jgi:hypothetical protein
MGFAVGLNKDALVGGAEGVLFCLAWQAVFQAIDPLHEAIPAPTCGLFSNHTSQDFGELFNQWLKNQTHAAKGLPLTRKNSGRGSLAPRLFS